MSETDERQTIDVAPVAKRSEADRLLKEARKCIYDDPDAAIDGLEAAMKLHDQLGISDHPASAPLYAAYGCALVESARANTDVFGAKAAPVAVTALGPHAGRSKPTSKPASSKQQKNQAAVSNEEEEGPDEEEDEDEGEDEGDDEGDDEGEEGEKGDLSSAWEMLEVARNLFIKEGEEGHLLELSDIHSTLSDICSEDGDFAKAAEELEKAMGYHLRVPKKDLRGEAELHFKLSCALQFNQDPEAALEQVNLALGKVERHKELLEVKLEPLDERIQNGDKQAEEELEKGEKELEGLEGVIQAIADKKEDLVMVVREKESIKQQITSMFRSALGTSTAHPPSSLPPSGSALTAGGNLMDSIAAASKAAIASLNHPAPTTTTAASTAAAATSGGGGQGAGGVVDLGVIGRGRGRVTLQPNPTPNPTAPPMVTNAPQTKKRTLEDLMGGAGAVAGPGGPSG